MRPPYTHDECFVALDSTFALHSPLTPMIWRHRKKLEMESALGHLLYNVDKALTCIDAELSVGSGRTLKIPGGTRPLKPKKSLLWAARSVCRRKHLQEEAL